jgi:hypothetical protein
MQMMHLQNREMTRAMTSRRRVNPTCYAETGEVSKRIGHFSEYHASTATITSEVVFFFFGLNCREEGAKHGRRIRIASAHLDCKG